MQNYMKKRFTLAFTALLLTTLLVGAPAHRGARTVVQPDGTEITVYRIGDEFGHYLVNAEGVLLEKDANGFLRPAASDAQENRRKIAQKEQKRAEIAERRSVSTRSNQASRGLVILVNFSNLNFVISDPNSAFTRLLNEENYSLNGATGSAKDYFTDASSGRYTPTFDVYGPYTLPQTMAYYGENDTDGSDKNPAQMVADACALAYADGVDFSKYDLDNNGRVDNVFIYYAGYNEAEWGPAESVWPHRWSITPGGNYGGTSGDITFNGKRVSDYACTSELKGDRGFNMCGVGLFCHEFSHVLGLPDLYPTGGQSHHTLLGWDLMDLGSYNNDGNTPPTYSAYQRFSVGWLTPTILNSADNYSLQELQESNSAYLVSTTGQHNLNGASPSPRLFYMLENRQQKGWDKHLPGKGMLITRINYSASRWNNNTVNNTANDMRVDIIEADSKADERTLAGDTYPNGGLYTSYTPFANYPITNITEVGELIEFQFMEGSSLRPILSDNTSFVLVTERGQLRIAGLAGGGAVALYGADGRLLAKRSVHDTTTFTLSAGIYLVLIEQDGTQYAQKVVVP